MKKIMNIAGAPFMLCPLKAIADNNTVIYISTAITALESNQIIFLLIHKVDRQFRNNASRLMDGLCFVEYSRIEGVEGAGVYVQYP